MSEKLTQLLLQLSETGAPVFLSGQVAAPFFGTAFNDLLYRQVIIERSRATEWGPCESCECDLGTRVIQALGDAFIAACPLDASRDVSLSEDDLRIFEIDTAAIIDQLCATFAGGEPQREVTRGVWLSGRIAEGTTIFITLERAAATDEYLPPILHSAAAGHGVTLIGPPLASDDRARLANFQIYYVDVHEAVCEGTLELDISQLLPQPAKPRFVLESRSKRVTLNGRSTVLTPRSFEMAVLLATAVLEGTVLVKHEKIENSLLAGQSRAAVPAADVIRDLRNQLQPLLRKGTDIKDLILARPARGYQLNLRASEILISR